MSLFQHCIKRGSSHAVSFYVIHQINLLFQRNHVTWNPVLTLRLFFSQPLCFASCLSVSVCNVVMLLDIIQLHIWYVYNFYLSHSFELRPLKHLLGPNLNKTISGLWGNRRLEFITWNQDILVGADWKTEGSWFDYQQEKSFSSVKHTDHFCDTIRLLLGASPKLLFLGLKRTSSTSSLTSHRGSL